MFKTFACREIGSSCERSIIALRSSHAGLAERSFQKIVLQCQLSDLGMQRLQIHGRCFSTRRPGTEDAGGTLEQLPPPGRNLVGMHIEKLRQIGQRPVTLDGGQSHPRIKSEDRLFALNPGVWFRLVRFVIVSPDMRQHRPLSGRKST